MKKKNNKPATFKLKKTPKNSPPENSLPNTSGRSFPVLTYLFFIAAFLNILVIVVIGVLIILIRFTTVKSINGKLADSVTFSYFLTRPDLLASAKSLIVYDAQNKIPLLSKNQSLRFSPASTIKIMTALVALDYYKPETILENHVFSYNPDSSRMGLYYGEKMSVLNLLYGMMLPSGSDAAEVLADNYPGGSTAFVSKMNEKAEALGLTNTHFVDPSGYSDDNYSTAYDLSRLGAYALKNPIISDIVKTKKAFVNNSNNTISHKLSNLNELLVVPGVTGIKTGFTNEAEGVLVTSFEHNKKTFIIAVLGSQDRFQDTRLLIEGILNDLKSESVSNLSHS